MSRRARAVSPRTNPLADIDPERRNAIFLYGGIGAVVVFALGLIFYGYYTDRIAPKQETVLTVGHRSFDVAFLERRSGAEAAAGKIRLDSGETVTLGIYQVLTTIEREETLRQAAAASGVTVSRDELDAKLKERLNLREDASRQQLATTLRSELLRLDLPLAEYEDIVRSEVINTKLGAQFEAAVPAEGEHADLRLIQLATNERAAEAKSRLEKGESPATVAGSMSVHSSRSAAGELGFVPRGSLPRKVEETAFGQTGVSDIIEAPEGFFIVETRGLEVRPLTPVAKRQVAERSVTTLLEKTQEEIGADRKLNLGQVRRIGRNLLQRVG